MANAGKQLTDLLPQQAIAEIEHWRKKYPADRARPAIIPSLTIAQEHHDNWLSEELMDAVAEYLQVEPIAVYEVATFYSMYHLQPMGKYVISVCTNVSCMLCGSDEIVAYLKQKLGIGFGETTEDGKFSLKEVECMAACGGAPMLEVNKVYYENLSSERIDEILQQLE